MAFDVGRVVDRGVRGLGTETAPGLLTEVVEVLTPDLHGSLTVLGAISWVEGIDSRRLVVFELCLIDAVSEVTCDRDLDSDFGGGAPGRRVIALQASECLKYK